MAQFDAAELITQREAVSNRIRTDLLKRASQFNIALEDVSITHMTFGKEFTRAVEQKQIAQTLSSNPNVTYIPGGEGKEGGKSTSLLLGLRS